MKPKLLETVDRMYPVAVSEPRNLFANRISAALKQRTVNTMKRQMSLKIRKEVNQNQDKIDKAAQYI